MFEIKIFSRPNPDPTPGYNPDAELIRGMGDFFSAPPILENHDGTDSDFPNENNGLLIIK